MSNYICSYGGVRSPYNDDYSIRSYGGVMSLYKDEYIVFLFVVTDVL